MLVTSQLPVQTTNIFYSFFHLHLCPPLWKRFRNPWSWGQWAKLLLCFRKFSQSVMFQSRQTCSTEIDRAVESSSLMLMNRALTAYKQCMIVVLLQVLRFTMLHSEFTVHLRSLVAKWCTFDQTNITAWWWQ